MLQLRFFKTPLTIYVLDIWPENLYSVLKVNSKKLRSLALCISNWHYNKADNLIAMSESLKIRLGERIKDKQKPLYVVPQHAEDFYATFCEDAALKERFSGRTVFVFAGNLSPAQNLEIVIQAVVNAHQRGFKDIHLLLVGSGMSKESLEAFVKEQKAKSLVTFYGRVDITRIPCFTELADALIVPLAPLDDLKLTIPAKLASCLAAGKPIIASLDGEAAQVVETAQCGFVSPAGDIDSLTNSFLRFMEADEDCRKKLGENAKLYYKMHYSKKKVIKLLEEILFP